MGDKKKKKGFWRLRATQEETAKATKQVEERNTPQSLRPEGLRMGKRKSRLGSRKQVQIKNQVSKNRKEKAEVESATPVNPEGTPDVITRGLNKNEKTADVSDKKAIGKQMKSSDVVAQSVVGQDWETFLKTALKLNKGATNIITDVEKNLNPGTWAAEAAKWYYDKYYRGK